MKYTAFHEDRFYQQVDNALISVKRILNTTRNPRLPHADRRGSNNNNNSVDHQYDDKYSLVTLLTRTSWQANRNVLERLGLSDDHFEQLLKWVHDDQETVTLRFEAIQTCKFLERKEVAVAVKNPTARGGDGVTVEEDVSTVSSGRLFGKSKQSTSAKTKTKVTVTVQEYHWKIRVHYKVIVFAGSAPDNNNVSADKDSATKASKPVTTIVLQQRDAGTTLCIQGTEKVPFCNVTKHDPIDLDLTWFLQQASPKTKTSHFAIQRNDPLQCKTPRRNTQIDQAVDFGRAVEVFAQSLQRFFYYTMERDILGRHNPCDTSGTSGGEGGATTSKPPPLNRLSVNTLHCPILPLMEEPRTDNAHSSPVLSIQDMDQFLGEQVRTLDERLAELSKPYPTADNYNEYNNDNMISTAEASLIVLMKHWVQLVHQYEDAVDYVEHLLQQQLVAAIGKSVQATDFQQFVSFHDQQLYGPAYAPTPFCFAIRRPNHYPDGILSLERTGNGTNGSSGRDPIETFVRRIPGTNTNHDGDDASGPAGAPPLRIPLNAATTAEMTGDRYLHGWIQHSFDDTTEGPQYQLAARARQFSCFLVMVGTMAGPTQFNPKDAIILQNKDEVLIPLLLNQLPTAQEFKDAVASLSPEQQRFATTFRGMQLESSVFGVCVIQLKPQLEDLLSLPAGSLTKEMKLTQDLLSLFIDYQIPSDMLSFDGGETESRATKVAAVKEYTKSVLEVIQAERTNQLKLEQQKTDMAIEKQWQQAKDIAGSVGNGEFEEFDASTITSGPTFRSMAGAMSARSPVSPFSSEMEDSINTSSRAGRTRSIPIHKRGSHLSLKSDTTVKTKHQLPPMPQRWNGPIEELAYQSAMIPEAAECEIQEDVSTPTSQQTFKNDDKGAARATNGDGMLDFTLIPKALDSKFDIHDTDHALRATIIKTGEVWTRKRQESLLSSSVKEAALGPDGIKSEKDKAFDLLDALSRSGSLPLRYSELHVIVAVTHRFENDVMGTVLQDNINPIEKVEKSSLMVASTIHGVSPPALLQSETTTTRLQGSFPALFDGEA